MAQAALYRKKLVEPGVWQSAQGPVPVTPERIAHWHDSFNALRKEGFNFPAPWGHKLTAVPTEDDPFAAEEAYARWNSGNIHRLEKERDGSLWMVAEVPPGYAVEAGTGRLVNERDGTVVTDVSPGIGNWVDGKGRVHDDIILHAALVTHPVQHNQTGFFPASYLPVPDGTRLLSTAGTIRFTHLLQTKGPPMADGDDDDKKKPAKTPAVEVNVDDDDDDIPDPDADAELGPMPDGSDAPLFEMPKKDDPADQPPTAKQDEYVSMIVGEMAKLGVPLIDGTDRNNILERVAIALHHASNSGASLLANKPGDEPAPPPDLGVPGVPDQSGVGGIGGYSFMSSGTGKPLLLEKTTAEFAAKAGDAEKANIVAELDKIAAVGPAAMQALVHEMKQDLNRQFLSVNPATGDVMLKKGRRDLAQLKKILKATGYHEIMPHLLSTAVPVPSPALAGREDDAEASEARQTSLAAEAAKQVFGQSARLRDRTN